MAHFIQLLCGKGGTNPQAHFLNHSTLYLASLLSATWLLRARAAVMSACSMSIDVSAPVRVVPNDINKKKMLPAIFSTAARHLFL